MNVTVKENKVIITPGVKRAKITTVGIQGPPGPDSFQIKGSYVSGPVYKKRDLVYYQGNTYYALVDTTTVPNTLNPAWQVFAVGNQANMISTSDATKSVQDRLNELDTKIGSTAPVIQDSLTIRKNTGTNSASINFPATGSGNDPAYIQHVEGTVDNSEMRISLGDNIFTDPTYADSLIVGSTPNNVWTPAYKFKDKLYFANLANGTFDNANLYRYDTNTLKTDGGLIVSSLNGANPGLFLRSDTAGSVAGTFAIGGYDLILGNSNQVDRGNTGGSRALVKAPGGILAINYAGDFTGGTSVTGNLVVSGNIASNYASITNTGTGQYSAATLNFSMPGNKSTDRSFNIFLQKDGPDATSTGHLIFRQDKGNGTYTDFMQFDFSSGVTNIGASYIASSTIGGAVSVGTTLGVTGATTLSTLTTSGTTSLAATTVSSLAITGNVTTEIKLPNDSQGITFYGGARIYKKAGYGLQIKTHDNNVPITFRDATDTFDTLAIGAYSAQYSGLTYQGKKVFNEGYMGAGSGLSADTLQGVGLGDFPRYSAVTGGTFIGAGYYWNTQNMTDAPMFNQTKFRFGIRVGELASNNALDYIRLLPGYSNSPIINFTQNGTDLSVSHGQVGYGIGPSTGDLVIKNIAGRLILDNTGASGVSGNGMQLKAAKDLNINIMDDANGTIKMLRNDLTNGVYIRPAQNSIDGIGGTLYFNAVGGSANNVAIGSTSNNAAKLHVTGTGTYTDKVYVHASAMATPNVTSTISLAIGDNDTGFNWVQDGKVNFMANNTIVGYWNTAGVVTSSSRALKENITPYTDSALELIDGIEVVNYNFIADLDKTPKVGFIAEDTDQLLTGHDHKGMDIGNTLGVLIKAVQELKDRVVYLEHTGDDK